MNPAPDARALAAAGLARVVAGESLRAVFAATASRLSDARDRALLAALLREGARWWLRFCPALDALLDKPLRARDADVHALLVLGLVQLEVLALPEYAAVAATVQATRALHKPGFAGLANAVQRRWLRERDVHRAALDANPASRLAHPPWLIAALQRAWPDQAAALLAANNTPAPLWLRVNRRRTNREAAAQLLQAQGHACNLPQHAPDALLLDASLDVKQLAGHVQGWLSVQDGAAQQAAALLDARDGMRVLDACAAPGGKAAHLLECANLHLVALDADARRLPQLRDNLSRLGLAAHVQAGDALRPADWWDGQPFDRILLDAPCSATGIVRRQPDVKLHRRETDIAALAATQTRLLDALWPLLRRGGRLVYATCSVLPAENRVPLATFLGSHPDARAGTPPLPWHALGAGMQNLPGESGMDGFFYAIVDKDN